jgi:hypothetical protein
VNVPRTETEYEWNQSSGQSREDRSFHAASVPEQSHAEQKQSGTKGENVADPLAQERSSDDQQNDRRECPGRPANPCQLVGSSGSLFGVLEVSRFHKSS